MTKISKTQGKGVKFETTVDNRLCVREYDIGYNDGYSEAYYSFHKIIDELLNEYEIGSKTEYNSNQKN